MFPCYFAQHDFWSCPFSLLLSHSSHLWLREKSLLWWLEGIRVATPGSLLLALCLPWYVSVEKRRDAFRKGDVSFGHFWGLLDLAPNVSLTSFPSLLFADFSLTMSILKHAEHSPTSTSLHLEFPLTAVLFPYVFYGSLFNCSNGSPSGMSLLTTIYKILSPLSACS